MMGGGVRTGMQRRPADPGKIEKARDARNALTRLLPYLRPFKWMLTLVLVFVLIYTVLGLIGPYLMGQAIDIYMGGKDFEGLGRLVLCLVLSSAACRAVWRCRLAHRRSPWDQTAG